uniref:Putative zinc knuckle CX2CX4HX4C n=1 Tax=Tanacetum cinerariifolium TaxID=118510 RepID=A0A6L2LW64_TANCI|nr:putative zinc knuckle CX2CX4HX4C [Tanacetum cinerariifolium]
MALPDHVVDAIDNDIIVLQNTEANAQQMEKSLASVVKIGVSCSMDTSLQRINNIGNVVNELEHILDALQNISGVTTSLHCGAEVNIRIPSNLEKLWKGILSHHSSWQGNTTKQILAVKLYGCLNSMLENGSWFIRNHSLILRKWNPDVDLLKDDVGNVPVWVKLYGVPITAFGEDGRSSYATLMIKLRADMELKDNIVVAMPKFIGEGYYTCTVHVEYEWKPSRCLRCFKPHKEYRPIHKKPTVSPSEFGTNRGTINLVNNGTNSSGSSFMNVKNSSTSYTPIIDKIEKFEDLLLMERVGFGTQSLLEQWRDSYGNGEYDEELYDDDMYE